MVSSTAVEAPISSATVRDKSAGRFSSKKIVVTSCSAAKSAISSRVFADGSAEGEMPEIDT